ncbi:MAG: ACT domain-containing protein [Nanoarchaeota archaeon]|nr:ACT domain-containing protein [Nanoarchaeota archaeon]
MVTISHIVRDIVSKKPLIYEGLMEGIISHAALAEYLQPEIEKELGTEVNLPAIVMAIRRYNETLTDQMRKDTKFKLNSEIIMKTGLADITILKSPSSMEKLKQLYPLVNYERGDTLNIIHGNYEITIVISEKFLQKVRDVMVDEKIINMETSLVSLSISFSSDFMHTPGILALVTRKLAWESINVYENISTLTELIYLINSKDSGRAYRALQELVDKDKP